MSEENIIVEINDGVCEIKFNRPDKKNAILGAMYEKFAKTMIDGNNDDKVRAFLICANGETFCAGNDIGDFLNNGIDFANSPQKKFFDSILQCEKPIVSAVQGKAVGIGTTMLLHFDINYAADNAQFSTPFVNLGLVPEGGSSLILPMKMGHQKACEILLLGDSFGAQEAHSFGIINKIVAQNELYDAAKNVALKFASLPINALKNSLALMRGNKNEIAAHIAKEGIKFGEAVKGEEARNAFMNFMMRKSK